MSNSPILTIVIPCYNAERYITRCVASLEELNNSDISLLFINDGSTDMTPDTIRNWVARRSNARMITKENGGYSTAINTGLDYCQTEYVMFMGVDDEIISANLNKICEYLHQNHPDILAFSTTKKYDDAALSNEMDLITQYQTPGYYEMDVFDLCKKNKNDVEILFTRDTSRCFKMAVIGDLRYYGRTGVSADGCFSTGVALRSNSFEFVNECCYVWHLHKDSVSGRNKTTSKILEELDVWNAYFTEISPRLIHKRVPSPIIIQFVAYKNLIERMYVAGEKETAKSYYKRSADFSKWLCRNASLSLKDRLRLMWPKLYLLFIKIKKKNE